MEDRKKGEKIMTAIGIFVGVVLYTGFYAALCNSR